MLISHLALGRVAFWSKIIEYGIYWLVLKHQLDITKKIHPLFKLGPDRFYGEFLGILRFSSRYITRTEAG